MQTIEAIYIGGKFQPLSAVALAENQKVRITFEPSDVSQALAWFAEAEATGQAMRAKFGVLPDSTPDIAADRRRDV